MKYFRYLKYILRHKWFVMIACFKVGLYWQGLMHDISKFLPDELIPYANYFYGKKSNDFKRWGQYRKPTTTDDEKFDTAWLTHLRRNKHHWQWWVLPEDSGAIKLIPMPDKYLKEMLCDWHGAGQAQGRKFSDFEWYQQNKSKMQLNKDTIRRLEANL